MIASSAAQQQKKRLRMPQSIQVLRSPIVVGVLPLLGRKVCLFFFFLSHEKKQLQTKVSAKT